ncbi:EthD domain-containing protein [Pseudoduganella sp. UC29_106]|uniref:EthD domain-containing protein n=1 Tax=Pseudoduganella sp. UC29_106 TaxID=3374553 RepID=UPI003757232A
MEKVIYALWREPRVTEEAFAATLRGELSRQLLALGARGLQVNVCDEAVAPAAALRQSQTQPPIGGAVSLWLDSANAQFRKPFDQAVAAVCSHMAAYVVSESVPIRNTRHPARPGERTEGFSQLAFLSVPPRLTPEAWLDIWHGHHTQVAIDTQDNFQYVQNFVVRPLTYGAPRYAAIVEECFPAAAMTDPQVFFDAPGDPEKFKRNLDTMMDSCSRFIDFDKIDVVPTSQYVMRQPAWEER